MARQIGTQFVGTIGNIIGYKWLDEYYLRTKGATKQTTEAKKEAAIFGLAVALSAKVRKALAAFLGTKTDRRMMYRLNNAFAGWLRGKIAEENIGDFCFYGDPVNSYFERPVLVNRQPAGYTLDIPPFAHGAKISTGKDAGLKIMAICCDLQNKKDTGVHETRVNMAGGLQQRIDLPLTRQTNSIIILVMSVNAGALGILAVDTG